MRRILVPFVVLLTLLVSCGAGVGKETLYKDLNAQQFSEALAAGEGYILLDVRTPGEFKSSRLEGAILMDFYDADFKEQLATLDPSKTVYVYCRSGNRSSQTGLLMQTMGFEEVYNLQGGIGAWQRKGYPVVK